MALLLFLLLHQRRQQFSPGGSIYVHMLVAKRERVTKWAHDERPKALRINHRMAKSEGMRRRRKAAQVHHNKKDLFWWWSLSTFFLSSSLFQLYFPSLNPRSSHMTESERKKGVSLTKQLLLLFCKVFSLPSLSWFKSLWPLTVSLFFF